MITSTTALPGRELGESVIFQPVLQAYPTHHSWIIMAYVSLGHLEHHWKTFNRQLIRTHQLLHFLNQQPSALTQLLSTLQVDLTNIEDMYHSFKTTIISAINLLHTNPSFDGQSQSHIHCRRSLLPFLGDALRWLTWTATTQDVNSSKTSKHQLIVTQSSQQESLVCVVSILNITRYAAQVNRHSINILMDKVDDTSHDINNLYNLTTSLATSISFHQSILHIRSVFANLHDSLNYIWMVSTHGLYQCNHIKNTISTHPTHCGSPKILLHISDTLPPTLHLPVSPDDTLHFYRYLYTHVLIANKQFLLQTDVPIQDQSQEITISVVFILNILYGHFFSLLWYQYQVLRHY